MSKILADIQGGVLILTLENERTNPINTQMADDFRQAIADYSTDIGAVVVTGAGERAFSTGSDIDELLSLHKAGKGPGPLLRQEAAAFEALASLDVPTIAAVHGLCLGGGLELALCCDFIFAARDAIFGFPEIHLGVFPALGGPLRISRRVSAGRVNEMLYDGRQIDAQTAHDWGLVDRVLPAGDTKREALVTAMRYAFGPRDALANIKRTIRAANDLPQSEALEASLSEAELHGRSKDADEGLRAIANRETPAFTFFDLPD